MYEVDRVFDKGLGAFRIIRFWQHRPNTIVKRLQREGEIERGGQLNDRHLGEFLLFFTANPDNLVSVEGRIIIDRTTEDQNRVK